MNGLKDGGGSFSMSICTEILKQSMTLHFPTDVNKLEIVTGAVEKHLVPLIFILFLPTNKIACLW